MLLGAIGAGCAAPSARTADAVSASATPSLADIFSIPGLHGGPPRLRSLSADGRWGLADFKPVVRDEAGTLGWGDDAGPHLVDVRGAEVELDESTSLAALLARLVPEAPKAPEPTPAEPPPSPSGAAPPASEKDEPRRPGPHDWSERGARLAVEWQGAIVLLDPATPSARVLYREDPDEKKESSKAEESAEAKPDDAAPSRLGRIRSLAFADDDRELEVRTARDLFVFDLAAFEGSSQPASLASARRLNAGLSPKLDQLQFSDDRSRVFATGGSFGTTEEDALNGAARFTELAKGRKVVLEGFAKDESLEGERLSPDGRFVFGVEADRSKESPANLVPDYLTERVSHREARRDRADDLPPARVLWMWDTNDGSRRRLEIHGDDVFWFAPIGWAPQPEATSPASFAFRRLSSDFRVQETWLWCEGALRLALIERDERWIGGPGGGARWSRDGSRLYFASECFAASTTPGRAQLFALDVRTGAVEQLTEFAGELSSYAEHDRGLALIASEGDPNERSLFLASHRGADGSRAPLRRVELGACVLSALRASRGGEAVVFELERLGRPAELWSVDVESGAAHAITRTVPAAYQAREWILPRELTVEHADGSRIWSHVYLPRGDSLERGSKRRPCVVFIHGAGYLQNVTQSMTEYAVNLMFHSRLASMGYVVVDVDYRGSAGYGRAFRTDVQGHLGKLELEDIAAVVDELARREVIDPWRVGCYGGSYGGFLTLMALFTEPERWACGAALRSVTDWRSYAAGYTQPRLGRPSTHAEAYARSSPIDHADGLVDPLLILHGLNDTNVFAQDSIRLIEKLIDLGKPFEAMLYPSQGHGFEDGPHWIDEYGRIERFLMQHLGLP